MEVTVCEIPECDAPPIKRFDTCGIHKTSYKGRGKMKCGICGKPQRQHELGFWEHDEITTEFRGGRYGNR